MKNSFCFVNINSNNINLLIDFINKIGRSAQTFRYFNKRDFKVIENHLVTLLLVYDSISVGYGHLDYEKDVLWLGICILPEYKGLGFGSIIMQKLIEIAKINKIDFIELTVDNDNYPAIKLYEKFFFKIVIHNDKYSRYRLLL